MTVKALTDGGTLEDRTRTLYDTEYGPMLTSILGLPLFPWTPLKAYALADSNYENFRYLNHFFLTNRAKSVRRLDEIEQDVQGIPWVNTVAADRKGEAYYSMDGAIPNVSDAQASAPWPAGCAGALGVATYPAHRDRRPGRRPLRVRARHRPRRGGARDHRAEPPPAPLPRRLRHQRQRQPLAVEPGGAADGLRPDHRRRGDRALAAHPHRADPGPGADRRDRRAPGQGVQAQAAAAGRARQPPVRGRAVARRAGRAAASRAPRRPARRGRSTSPPPARRSPAGTSTTTSTPTARSSSAASSRTCSPTSSSSPPGSRAASTPART